MKFERIEIKDWKQYSDLQIDFHPRVTVLTGANGAGKTTILRILAQHFGWQNNQLTTPHKNKETGIISFFSRFFHFENTENMDNTIGKIIYSGNREALLQIPQQEQTKNSPTYGITIKKQIPVSGFFIPSHRPAFFYAQIPHISTTKRMKAEAYNVVSQNYMSRVLGSGGNSTSYYIKETLLGWAINGYGNIAVEADKEQMSLYEDFQKVLKRVLPRKLGFQGFSIRNYEVVMITETGEFMLDAVSGGISAIIDLAWQVFMFPEKDSDGYVVIIDEIENHLHAEMQRELLPNFIDAFPRVQFVVSTHSPLIVGSVKDSSTYALTYENSKIKSIKLDLKSNAGDANQILRKVLGVPVTMPIWVEKDLQQTIEEMRNKPTNETTLIELRHKLKGLGLEDLMPEAVIKAFAGK